MSRTTSESLTQSLSQSLNQPLTQAPMNTLIRAGAGAGKTTELINRVLGQIIYFQKTENRDPRLVVTTFTRKATQEIRERLLAAAQNWGDPRVLKYVQTSPYLSIATIHASLQKFLSVYGNKIGLAPEYSFIGGSELRRLEKRALRDLLTDAQMADRFSILLDEWDLSHFWEAFHLWSQQKVMTEGLRPLKLQELLHQKDLLLKQVQSKRRSLAQELETIELTPGWKTYRDLCLAPPDLMFEQEVRLWENPPRTTKSKNIPEDVNERKKELADLAKTLTDWSLTDEFMDTHEKLAQVFPVFAEALLQRLSGEKRRRGQLAMADLENWSLRLARHFPESAQAFSETWDFWMIDEYQDTSPLQVEILRRLIGRKPEFVVGDPQQSIYLFRGARSQVFIDKEAQMRESKSELLNKMINYRSKPTLMNFINRLLPEMSAQFQEMQTNPHPKNFSYSGPDAVLWSLPKLDKEALEEKINPQVRALAQRIEDLLKTGETPNAICILARTNAEVSEISEGLQACGLSVFSHRPALAHRRREVRDALSYLKFLVQPQDNKNLIELLRSPWFRVDDEILFQLSHTGNESFWSRRKSLDPLHPALIALENDLELIHSEGVFYRWIEGLKLRGFFDFSYVIDSSGQREANLWKLISELRWSERTAGFSYSQFVEDHLDQVGREDQVTDEVPAVVEPSRVQIMTIHAAKGLEFEHVMLASAGSFRNKSQRTPVVIEESTGTYSFSLKTKDKEEWASTPWSEIQIEIRKYRELEEYDRLLYVALTRAKQSLTLVWETPVKDSWAKRWPDWVPKAPGVQSVDSFQVELRDQNPQEVRFASGVRERFKAIQPWMNLTETRKEPRPEIDTAISWSGLQLISDGIETHHYLESLQENWETVDQFPAQLRGQLQKDKNVNFEHLIKKGFVEWGFVFKQENYLKQGRIDLWGRDEKGLVWIVDYKTGSPKYRDKAMAQLKDYARALILLKQVTPTESILLYPLYLSSMKDSKPEKFMDKV